MKRYLRLLCVLLVIFILGAALPPGQAASQGGTVVRVSPEAVTLSPGETTTIDVEVVNVVKLRAFSVEIHFDPDLISVSNLALGDFLNYPGFDEFTNDIDNMAGKVMYGYAIEGNENVQSGTGILFSFDVTVKLVPGETRLVVMDTLLVDLDHDTIDPQLEHGLVRISTGQEMDYHLYLPLIMRP